MDAQQDVRVSDIAPVRTGDTPGVGDLVGMEAPEGYIPPDADVTESMPPQCSF